MVLADFLHTHFGLFTLYLAYILTVSFEDFLLYRIVSNFLNIVQTCRPAPEPQLPKPAEPQIIRWQTPRPAARREWTFLLTKSYYHTANGDRVKQCKPGCARLRNGQAAGNWTLSAAAWPSYKLTNQSTIFGWHRSVGPAHGLINYINTKEKCRHLKKMTWGSGSETLLFFVEICGFSICGLGHQRSLRIFDLRMNHKKICGFVD